MKQRKGQNPVSANNSAIFVIIITVLIVLYILFLPPQERAELLGEDNGGSGGGGSGGGGTTYLPTQILLEENVGHIDYLSTDEREHNIPSFRVSTTTGGSVIKSLDSLYVKSSVFDSIVQNVTFKIDEDLTSDLRLSFNTGKVTNGRLILLLNGRRILDEKLSSQSSQIVKLPADELEGYNTLTFGVSSPGWAFWSSNEYQLDTLQVTGDVKDVSSAVSEQSFILEEEEVLHLERATLKYYADCTASAVGRLTIELNGRSLFSGQADCGIMNTIELDERMLDGGKNELVFATNKGTYLITNVVVKTLLEKPIVPIYYFQFDDDYFFTTASGDEACGNIDGACPDGCSADKDKDCCFEDAGSYWCDFDTDQLGDRCVSFVTAATCGRCDSGYEDSRGRAADACEGLCGDDYDDECLAGCSKYVDKDCCFANGDNYWCDDAPAARPLSSICKPGVEPDEREDCPSRYYDESGKRLSFTVVEEGDDEELKSAYKTVLSLAFPNNDLKSATLIVNGHEIGLETREVTWERDISTYVRSGTNSIQIEPARTIDITSLKVSVKRK